MCHLLSQFLYRLYVYVVNGVLFYVIRLMYIYILESIGSTLIVNRCWMSINICEWTIFLLHAWQSGSLVCQSDKDL